MSKLDQLREMRERSNAPRTTARTSNRVHAGAGVAQMVEQPPCKRDVVGSIPTPGTKPTYSGPVPFDHRHYNAWYQKHVYRPRRRGEK